MASGGEPILSHARLWAAIDAFAARRGTSPSGLAKLAGLDSTTFNRSKRQGADGRPRWPSTQSIAKLLEATNTSLDEFFGLLGPSSSLPEPRTVPLMGFAEAACATAFDGAGRPAGPGWDAVRFPGAPGDGLFALEVTGSAMLPLYRDGDLIVVAPRAEVRRGDRVLARLKTGALAAGTLARTTPRRCELAAFQPGMPVRSIDAETIDWIGRILWASQ